MIIYLSLMVEEGIEMDIVLNPSQDNTLAITRVTIEAWSDFGDLLYNLEEDT